MKRNAKITLLKGLFFDFFVCLLQFGSLNPTFAVSSSENTAPTVQQEMKFSEKELLKNSQISYRADGGFTGVQSYGVILSCVNGKISVMKSIYDPRLNNDNSKTREIGTMEPAEYVSLWKKLNGHALFKLQDCPSPKMDIRDEFTLSFYAKIGNQLHQFQVTGVTRTEASRYFAIRGVIDNAVNMQALWEIHNNLAKNVASTHIIRHTATLDTPQ